MSKLIKLYNILIFTGKRYSTTELMAKLGCSRQQVRRLVDNLHAANIEGLAIDEPVDGQTHYFQVTNMPNPHGFVLENGDVETLALCRDLVCGVLPCGLAEKAESIMNRVVTTLGKDLAGRPKTMQCIIGGLGGGRVNYSKHEQIILDILKSIRTSRRCNVTYSTPCGPKSCCVAFTKVIIKHGTLYARGWKIPDRLTDPDPDHAIMFVIQHITQIDILSLGHELKDDESESDSNYGVINQNEIRVKVRFAASAAQYVRDRIWSKGYVCTDVGDGEVVLEFTARNTFEVKSMVLSFGDTAEILEPNELRVELKMEISKMLGKYHNEQ